MNACWSCATRRRAKSPKMKPDVSRQRRRREQSGRRAETAAALWLQLKGYRVLERRARTPACEIDLVVRKGRTIAFVEVKSRRTIAAAREAVTPDLRRRLEQAAHLWAARRLGALGQ
ncbi:MAG: hypothetical protein B7Y90_18080 [Alphaproteobacteria bacterium 32-64-14]|nr:MAG: hypothetical protein B7Y90_18080 [Alphaproteobacteria bacterium 32-64-14]